MENIIDILKKFEADGFAADPTSEILKLEVGEFVTLELLDIESFVQDNKTRKRYTVRNIEKDLEQTLFGSVQLDQALTRKQIGDTFILLRIENKPIVGRPQPMSMYKTFSKKEE